MDFAHHRPIDCVDKIIILLLKIQDGEKTFFWLYYYANINHRNLLSLLILLLCRSIYFFRKTHFYSSIPTYYYIYFTKIKINNFLLFLSIFQPKDTVIDKIKIKVKKNILKREINDKIFVINFYPLKMCLYILP